MKGLFVIDNEKLLSLETTLIFYIYLQTFSNKEPFELSLYVYRILQKSQLSMVIYKLICE